MTRTEGEERISGLVFVIAAVIGLFLPGTAPKADEVGKIVPYFADKHGPILASDFLVGLAFAFFLLFASVLRSHVAAHDRTGSRPGSAIVAGAAAFATLVMAASAVLNAAAFSPGVLKDPNLTHALYYVGNDIFTMAGFGLAAFFAGAAAAIAVSGALPAPLAPAALLLAVLNAVSGVALFAKDGFFAIGGAYGYIVPLASLLWILVVSVVMLRPGAEGAPAAGSPRARAA